MRLAILDDDGELCAQVAAVMRSSGHSCFEFHSGEALRRALRRESYDLLLLDWELPDLSGVDLLAWARSNLPSPPPVIMLTGRTDDSDIVHGLDTGADDNVTKPVQTSVLKARVDAVLRRAYGAVSAPRIESFGDLVFDPIVMTVAVRGEAVEVTAKEFGLALLLFRNLNRPLSRAHIMEAVGGAIRRFRAGRSMPICRRFGGGWGCGPNMGCGSLRSTASVVVWRASIRV